MSTSLISAFSNANQQLSIHQSGFRRNDSITNQLVSIIHTCATNLIAGKDVRYLFLDIENAFDRVWHKNLKNLLFKLHHYGIRGNLLKWLKSYLTDRRIRVVIGNVQSKWVAINAGVPQGAVLAPQLFLIYINDLPDVTQNTLKLFADDSSLLCFVGNHEDH